MTNAFLIFIFLQVADFGTTALALRLGGAETNPVVAHFMTAAPITGLFIAKLIALGIGLTCLLFKKYRAINLSNIAFSGIVAWNLTIVARLLALSA